ncbi:uncharacterized protein LOC111113192 isoform X2 [Crassostrea virginica]|uniref:Multiple epidermal growth factor-like domains protein 10 isoform X2 n=1 Tax=Crassostrea virginica TaxID=6565 RepID=A0A8B8BVS6_CRAVI|nr:multiple epidermal growth factor-like domains protein 10 isoform X2 [Crassostrea virginica]
MYAVVLLVCCSWVALLCPSVQAYENLALHKPAWQGSTWVTYPAERAVDGRYTNLSLFGGQCVWSWSTQIAEWRVDLGFVLSIHHVFIQYMVGNKMWGKDNFNTRYFLGFAVYISNTTNKDDGVLCFRDTNYTPATIPNPVNITCPYHGRYVIYYNNRTHPPYPDGYAAPAYIALCEVEVYECGGHTYGLECKHSSGNCSGGVQCDHVTGSCPSGCDAGMFGDNCDQACDNKSYGLDCRESCGNCSNRKPCHHVDGSCQFGCDVGVFGLKCNTDCTGHTYGLECKQSCGKCSGGVQCDHVTGRCPNGCDAGMYGDRCDFACDNKTYGLDCRESCGNCSNGEPCHHVDGSCPFGCDDGVFGFKCTTVCSTGLYGTNCAKTCGPNCQNCNRFNGVCEFGCHPGWTGTYCEKRCKKCYNVCSISQFIYIGFGYSPNLCNQLYYYCVYI